jgi:hypothetical protein
MEFEFKGIGFDLFRAEKVLKKSTSLHQACKLFAGFLQVLDRHRWRASRSAHRALKRIISTMRPVTPDVNSRMKSLAILSLDARAPCRASTALG